MLDLAPYAAAIIGAVAAFATAYFKGRKDADNKNKIQKAKADEKTHERINSVAPVNPDNRAGIVERLRRLGQ
jgi:hypothetical protein